MKIYHQDIKNRGENDVKLSVIWTGSTVFSTASIELNVINKIITTKTKKHKLLRLPLDI